MRALALVLALLVAAAAPAGAASAGDLRLVVGDEIPLGTAELGPWPGYGPRPSIASDGDRTLIAYIGGSTLQAVMLDRNGTLLTDSPLLLHASFDNFGQGGPRVLWSGGHYVVLFNGPGLTLRAIRLTAGGEIAARVDLSALGWVPAFDAATDGEEIVIVTPGAKLFRLTSTLEPQGPPIPATEDFGGARDVAFGGGRVAVVTNAGREVVIQFVDDGALTPPVRIAEAHHGYRSLRPSVDVKWTGSRFVAAWTECAEERCLAWWAPLGESGAPASLPVPIAHLDHQSRSASEHAVAVVPLDEETIFVRWEAGSIEPAYGRRYSIDGRMLDEEPLKLGRAGVEAFRTAHDLLLTADMSIRMTVTRAPVTAPLANPLSLVPMARTTAGEIVRGAAASESEIAILRSEYREAFETGDSIVTITTRDGRVLRHIDVDDESTAIASDGHDFYLMYVTWGEQPTVWLRNLAGTWRVRISRESWAFGGQLVWTGSGLVALWSETGGGFYDYRLQPFSKDGVALAPARTFDPSVRGLQIGVDRGKLLLTWYDDEYVTWTMRVEPDGTPLEAPRMLAKNASAHPPVSNGALTAIGFQKGSDAAVELRADGVPYARVTLPTYDDVDHAYGIPPSLAIAGELVFAVYRVSDWYGRRPAVRAALLHASGSLEHVQQLFAGPSSYPETQALLPISGDAVLLVYQRHVLERPHLGQTRTYARVLTAVRSPGRRRSTGR